MGCFCSKIDDVVVEKPQQHCPAVTGIAPASPSNPYTEATIPTGSIDDISPYYTKLPSDAIKVTVRNVYDGDTVTLTDERRVRLIGIDTPEIKGNQPYAQEAKQYTSNLCNRNDIWIVHEPNHEKQDHYGRLLAWVYVMADSNRYLCVNEGIIAEGLGSVYLPDSSTKFQRQKKLFAQQKVARNKKLNIWKKFANHEMVIITKNGAAYHKASCEYISKSKNIINLTASEALDRGLHPCRKCQS